MKNSKTLRTLCAVAIIVAVTIGFVTNLGIGTISAPGFWDISVLCPLGALGTMLASKTMVPRAIISLVLMIVLIILFARAFCGWMCPIPLVSKLRGIFSRPESAKKKDAAGDTDDAVNDVADGAVGEAAAAEGGENAAAGAQTATAAAIAPLTAEEKAALSGACEKDSKGITGCASCAAKRGDAVDARHWVLGGAIISTFAFGFPVFCLICPIGLTFATIMLVINLFAHGDVTWTVIVVPLLLACEVIFFRKWCTKLCPLSAFMSLVAKLNRTFVPTIDDAKCLETAKGAKCGRCGKACEEGIDPRHPELSEAAWSECTKCRSCVDACPASAISMPFLYKKDGKGTGQAEPITLAANEGVQSPIKE